MVKLPNAAANEPLSDITDDQLQFLVDQFEEEWEGDQDYYINTATIDMLEDPVADPALLALQNVRSTPLAKPTSAGRASDRLHHQRRPPRRLSPQAQNSGRRSSLLHGFIADGRVWRKQIDDFSRDFDVIAWDAPGCGKSSDPPEDFSMEDYARCLLALLNDAGVEAPHLLGLSWGGTLALEFHRLFPQHVRSIIIADSYAGWTGSPPRRRRKHGSTGP